MSLVTLEQFIIDREKGLPDARGDFSQLLRDIGLAAKFIHREVNRAGLTDIIGQTGDTNIQGEVVQKLDVFANRHLISALRRSGVTAVLGSEEENDIIVTNDAGGKYVVLFDPLDGSSNIDVGVPVGTIFAIYNRISANGQAGRDDCLQPGRKLLAAGYVLYGSSTLLVYSTGNGVHGFTLEPTLCEFFLSHPDLRTPEEGPYISLNDQQIAGFPSDIQAYLAEVRSRNARKEQALKSRYVGSLVADFHRTLLHGGIFLYPGTTTSPEGKLRLLYEANPMAFLMEQAGGVASDGRRPILDILPERLHQRTPFMFGSAAEMARLHIFTLQTA